MHTAQFNNSVHSPFAGQLRQSFLFIRIANGQTQCLNRPIKLRDDFLQMVRYKHRQRLSLNRRGDGVPSAQQNGPFG